MRALLGLLLVAGSAGAATTQVQLFTVEGAEPGSAIVGDALVLEGFTVPWNPFLDSWSWGGGTNLTWHAADGYKISGFTAVYDLFFAGGSLDTLQLGTVISTASFESSDGARWDYAYPPTVEKQLARQDTAGSQWNASYELKSHGLGEGCWQGGEPSWCQLYSLFTTATLNSITVTPHVVPAQQSAIPEPSTYALMLAGVAFLLHRQKRRGRQSLT